MISSPTVNRIVGESDTESESAEAEVEQNEQRAKQDAFLSGSSEAETETVHSPEPLTELEIRYDTPSLNSVTLSRGPIEVKVSYTAREDITPENRPLLRYEIFHEGELSVKDAAIAVGSGSVLIGDFDQDGGMEVAVQAFTGGAHCCLSTTVYSWNGRNFNKLSLDEMLGGEFEDIDGDGSYEFVTIDSDFLAKFSSYAGSVAPPMIFSLVDGEFINSTQDYPDYIYSKIADLEHRNQQQMNAHSLLAAYVASKSLVGEVESGWAYMLNHYSQDPALGLGMSIRDQNGEVVDRHPNFPTALEAFLIEQGYL
ncbi:hypothetical protein [cf. Phormidesmis sp. LEGE 11477]|uniref:hypothetical protein n=1 Tax=cf. Phormidesmis sp. LEGE 11477 TaxID=1828680 RepID=UPI0018830126|nr:hypothetical protein [cf. Phormidesmis sp. LEGE 11477]MBE9059979.1 hypothetical protein [cf. Phormidesmis sp. LEGE 11477]